MMGPSMSALNRFLASSSRCARSKREDDPRVVGGPGKPRVDSNARVVLEGDVRQGVPARGPTRAASSPGRRRRSRAGAGGTRAGILVRPRGLADIGEIRQDRRAHARSRVGDEQPDRRRGDVRGDPRSGGDRLSHCRTPGAWCRPRCARPPRRQARYAVVTLSRSSAVSAGPAWPCVTGRATTTSSVPAASSVRWFTGVPPYVGGV